MYKERRDFYWDLDLSSDPAPWIQVPKEVEDERKPRNPEKKEWTSFGTWICGREGGR
jgi:hypothetical protein